MTRARCYIAVPKQRALIDVGIKLGFGRLVSRIARPADEIGNGARRPIAIKHLDDKAASRDVTRDLGQGVCGRLSEQTTRRAVTVDRPTDEIVRARITD